jgi:3-hydroxybutyryl-CoA dehydrogenase
MTIKKVFVVGSGLMGSGISQVFAQAGLDVLLYDIDKKALERAIKNMMWSLNKFFEKGKITEDGATVMKRVRTVSEFSGAGEADLLIEAVFENLELKREVFQKLDEAAGPNALLASNTSAISITELAAIPGGIPPCF